MNFDETIDAFRRGALDLDCTRMVLSQRKEGGERYEEYGYIRQSQSDGLVFKIYVAERENASPLAAINAQLSAAVGKIHHEEMYYDLSVVEWGGTNWTAARIIPSVHWDASADSVLIDGQIQSMATQEEGSQKRHYLRLHFFEEYDLPLDLLSETERLGNRHLVRDRAEFEACGAKFEVKSRQGSGDTVVEATSDTAFSAEFHLRVQEALQYITGKSARWRAKLEGDTARLRLELEAPWRRSIGAKLPAPISSASIEFSNQGWRLFVKYLDCVVTNTEGTYWNPVAYHLYNACEATANSIDAWAVGVSLAVEAIAGLIAVQPIGDGNERLAIFQKRMGEYLLQQKDFEDFIPRMKGSIEAMSNRRAIDALHALAITGHVEKAYIAAWSRLRNAHVHPNLGDLKKRDPGDNQKLIDYILRVEVLLRQLTYYLIGYDGPFTDYGAEKWPIKQYPLDSSC